MEEELKRCFNEFANFGNRHKPDGMMDSRSCLKLARDCNVLKSPALTGTDIDLIFTKVKQKGERKINYQQFLESTRMWAQKLDQSHAEVIVKIAAGAPKVNGLLPGQTKQHDARENYTGVHKHGGPSLSDTSPKSLSHITNRSACDIRGVPLEASPTSPAGFVSKKQTAPRIMPRLHPDWYEVENPDTAGNSEMQFYYVNSITGETQWKAPFVIVQDITPPPPPPPLPSNPRIAFGKTATSETFPSVHYTPDQSPPDNRHSDDIVDRLTNVSLYTGAHKHRFDIATGKGKGLDGRDNRSPSNSEFTGHTNTNSDEIVHSIAHVLRQ